jgi:release factor glutamine methyltransferase
VLEIGADQGEAVRVLLEQSGFEHIEIRKDLAGHDRIAVATFMPCSTHRVRRDERDMKG